MVFYLASILNAGAFFGCYELGIVADAGLWFFDSLIITSFDATIVAFAWTAARTPAGIVVWTAAYGLLSGAIQAIFSPCISLLAPSPEVIGTLNGESLACSRPLSLLTALSRPLHHSPCVCSPRWGPHRWKAARARRRYELRAHAGIHGCLYGRLKLPIPCHPTVGISRREKESLAK